MVLEFKFGVLELLIDLIFSFVCVFVDLNMVVVNVLLGVLGIILVFNKVGFDILLKVVVIDLKLIFV